MPKIEITDDCAREVALVLSTQIAELDSKIIEAKTKRDACQQLLNRLQEMEKNLE